MTDAFSRILNAGPASSPAAPPPTGSSSGDAFSRIMGTTPAAVAAPASDPNAEPDAKGLVGGLKQMVRGKRDPRFADVHGLHGLMVQEKNEDASSAYAAASLTGASDAALGDIYQEKLGDRFISREQDANGYEIVTYRGPDAQPKRGYVNRPGLEMEDISRAVTSSLPFMAAGGGTGVALRGAGTALRIAGQSAAAGATSVGGDLASNSLGSKQSPDLGKAVVTAGAAGAGEVLAPVVGAAYRRFIAEPRLFNRATGQLTSEGEAAAVSAGYDPAQMTDRLQREFAKTYAKTGGDAASSVAAAADFEFQIPSTLGQRTKDAQQLLEEKGMRYGLQGDTAKNVITDFDKRQAEAIKSAALDGTDQVKSIAQRLAPHRYSAELSNSVLGPEIRSGLEVARGGAKTLEKEAWSKVSGITPKPKAFELLPNSLMTRLGTLPVDDVNTPTAAAMARSIDEFVEGKASSQPVAKVLRQANVTTLDEMRRRLLHISDSANTNTDRKAAQALYDGFNDWIDTAAREALLNGDVEVAAAMRVARDTSKTMRQIFQPTGPTGRATAGAKIIDDVLQRSDSAEGIVSGLFGGGPAANVPDGTIEALRLMRGGLQKYAPEAGGQTWNDIRVAYWVRLVRDKTGETFTPGNMLRNIKLAQNNQASVMKALYSPAELGAIARFRRALEQATYKDPNPSGSGVAIAAYAKQFLGKVLASVPYGDVAWHYSGLPSAIGKAAARRAVSTAPAASNSATGPYAGALSNAFQFEGDGDQEISQNAMMTRY